MANIGNAQLSWSGGSLNLRLPLQRKRPARRSVVFQRISLDGTARSVRRVGSGQYSAWVTVRYEGDRANLMAFLVAAIEAGEVITYTPDTDTPANNDDFVVIQPESVEDALQLNADAPVINDEWDTVELQIMKQDGTDFSHLYTV